MTDIYNYQANITVTTTPNGDKVITMNSAIFDMILNDLFDAQEHQNEQGHDATARDTLKLWRALANKEKAK
jgi:hypothetical protein